MKMLLEQLGIALLGLVTTLLVVITEITVWRWTTVSLVGTRLEYVIPIGAIVGGAVAASGYYFGAIYTHSRTGPSLLLLMVMIAALAYFLIYWLEYTHVHDGDAATFWEFVQSRWTHTRLRGRGSFNVSVFGYVLGLLEFIGFLLGGLCVYWFLAEREMCPSCNLYLSSVLTSQKEFADENFVVSCLDGLEKFLASPHTSAATTGNSVITGNSAVAKSDNLAVTRDNPIVTDDNPVATGDSAALASPKPLPMRVSFELMGCPICKYQVLKHRVAVKDGEDWKDIDPLAGSFHVPAGVDVKSHIG